MSDVITTERQEEEKQPLRGCDTLTNPWKTAEHHDPGPAASLTPAFLRSTCPPAPTTMVEQSDRAPLLDWEEIPPPDPNHQAAQPPPPPPAEERSTEAERTPHPAGRRPPPPPAAAVSTAVTYSPTRNLTAVVVSRDRSLQWNLPFPCVTPRDQWAEKDQIVSVFVVTFDTRSGEETRICSFYKAENGHCNDCFLRLL